MFHRLSLGRIGIAIVVQVAARIASIQVRRRNAAALDWLRPDQLEDLGLRRLNDGWYHTLR